MAGVVGAEKASGVLSGTWIRASAGCIRGDEGVEATLASLVPPEATAARAFARGVRGASVG